jgi:hypothetical protein
MTSDDIQSALAKFDAAIATMKTGDAAWEALRVLSQALVGGKLFTVMTVDWENERAGRVFTSHPEEYPVSGTKPIHYDSWFDVVHRERKPFVANTIADIAKVFSDHELIWSLGCGSVVNLPIEIAGAMVGTVNLLDAEHFYTPDRVAMTAHLKLPAKTAYLASFYFERSGA